MQAVIKHLGSMVTRREADDRAEVTRVHRSATTQVCGEIKILLCHSVLRHATTAVEVA